MKKSRKLLIGCSLGWKYYRQQLYLIFKTIDKMKKLTTLNYLVAAALVTVLMLLIYAAVQQGYRTGLNDPQVQMARDISLKLEEGRSIQPYFTADTIDINRSLSPFVVLYDAQGKA